MDLLHRLTSVLHGLSDDQLALLGCTTTLAVSAVLLMVGNQVGRLRQRFAEKSGQADHRFPTHRPAARDARETSKREKAA